MLKFEQINQDIATLPETDQQLVIDFIEILKKRQVSQSSIKKSVELDNNSFIELAILRTKLVRNGTIGTKLLEIRV